MERITRALLILLCSLLPAVGILAAEPEPLPPLIHQWLGAQTNITTWRADVVQYRFLQTLKQPLVSTGEVWFAAPNQFRWQLGNPPLTIAIRDRDAMTIVYPRLKRAERYDFGQAQKNQWKDTLKLLEAGFPRSARELQEQFNVLEINHTNQMHELRLEPRSVAARKMMPQIGILISTNDWTLRGTELQFADGSRMRNLFNHPETNITISAELFQPNLGPEFKITEPLKSAR